MSSCCTFRLNRRRAFSSDSPSCNLTSANGNYTPKPVLWDSSVIARWAHKVKHYMELLIHPSAIGTDSESETQSKLQLTRCIRVRCLHEIRRHLIICRKVIDSNVLSPKLEACRIVHEAVIRELESAIKAVE